MKEKLKAIVTLEIEYDTASDRCECLADARRELKEGLGRGCSSGFGQWTLTKGRVLDEKQ